MKVFIALVRREMWEHRTLWLTPLIIALLVIVAVAGTGQLQIDVPPGPPRPGGFGDRPPNFSFGLLNLEVPFFVVAALVVVAYLLDCLYAERRDRSILFWKSLPVSDAAVVWSKFTVALLIVPLLYFACAAVTSLVVAGILALRGQATLYSGALPFNDFATWLRTQGFILYGTLATVLWYAPFAAYVMVISAWARRAVLAWVIVPPVLLALLERLIFDTNVIGRLVQRGFNELYRLAFRVNQQLDITLGDVFRAPRGGRGGGPDRGFDPRFDPSDLLRSPQLWSGLLVCLLLLWLAIAVRRRSKEA